MEVFEVMGDTTNMILMAMGDDHAADSLLVLAQVTGIWQDNIHAMHSIAWESETTIDKHDVIAILEDTSILADFMQPP